MSRQLYFDEIILPFLQQITYDEKSEIAIRWQIADLVMLDPAIRFGKPIVEKTGITTSTLRQAYYANGEDAARVAQWFGIEERHVMAAVKFEDGLAA